MSEVSEVLTAIQRGEPRAAEQLLPLVYQELRRLAVQKLHPGSQGGDWKLRFYDAKGWHEISFDGARADPEVAHVVENLKILGYLWP